jgi:hypothetical protein
MIQRQKPTTDRSMGTNMSAPNQQRGAYTLVAKIKPGHLDALREVLAEAQKEADERGEALSRHPLTRLATVHFLRVALLDDNTFLFASHFDGDVDDYLDDFFSADHAKGSFDRVFRHLEDWPGPGNHDAFVKFWKDHGVKSQVVYAYFPDVTVKEMEKALRTRKNLEAVLQDFQ